MSQPIAIVTGASAGIGFEAARKLAGKGFTVYAGARRVDRMAPLRDAGVRVVELDVTDDQSMRAAVGRVLAERGRVDVLVNNAGYGSYGALTVSIIEPASTRTEWGGVAAEGLKASSGAGPYDAQARDMAAALASTHRPAVSTPPAVIAEAILHAATSAHPKTRYPVGRGAGTITALRRVLPDRLYDVVVLAVLKKVGG
jgi:NAD(P)-dependent dehydrogenase (short-subunit alcohol dehydrogenase family)